MKRFVFFLLSLSGLFILGACAQSPQLEGQWQAQDALKMDTTIDFGPDTVTINGQERKYTSSDLTRKNGLQYFLIQVQEEGENFTYSVIFPDEDSSLALFIQPENEEEPFKGQLLFALNKKEKPDYYVYLDEYLK